ncbi:hypothetical protein ARMGADRAFT_937126, partial [Armillaria gallica]
AMLCKQEGLAPLQLLKWAINKFCALADDSPKVPNLKKKKYANFKILPEEWKLLALIMEVLDFEPVSHELEAAIMKIEKWSLSVEQNKLYFICIGESLFLKSHLG